MAKVKIICAYCGKEHLVEFGEYNYWIKKGRKNFFCCRSCAAKHSNQSKKRQLVSRTLTCPVCNKEFVTDRPYDVTFCSRSCASKGSVSDYRRQRMSDGGKAPSSVKSAQMALKRREAWKYARMKTFLDSISEAYEFEYLLDGYIFDLALLSRKILVEFDGDYHTGSDQLDTDETKEVIATSSGWRLVRVATDNNCEIDPRLVLSLVSTC